MIESKNIVIGAGLAGLAVALRLKHKGENVLVIEKNDTYGGKLSSFKDGEFRFDNGPSLLTEPELIDELFLLFEKNPRDYFNYVQCEDSCIYHFENYPSIHFYRNGIIKEQGNTKHPEQSKVLSYIQQAYKDYTNIGGLFLNSEKPSFSKLFGKKFLKHYPYFLTKRFRGSLNNYNSKTFKDPRLIQILNRFGTYNGSNPFHMSGLYSMISHLELEKGAYFPIEGMRSIVDALYNLAKQVGIQFEFNETASAEKTNKGYKLTGKNQYCCERLICAIDHLTFYQQVLHDNSLLNRYKRQERSSSALVFYWGINTKINGLGLHNIIFSNSYKEEFESLFKNKTPFKSPTIYIHNSSVVAKSDAPLDGQNLFIMINTPANKGNDESYIEQMKDFTLKKIESTYGVNISRNLISESHWTSKDIENITGSWNGALYGASSNSMTSSFKRHGNQTTQYPNLYFCGGTVHPGGGIPLVLRSAKIVSQLIHE